MAEVVAMQAASRQATNCNLVTEGEAVEAAYVELRPDARRPGGVPRCGMLTMTPSLARLRKDLLPSLSVRRGGAPMGAGDEALVNHPTLLLPL